MPTNIEPKQLSEERFKQIQKIVKPWAYNSTFGDISRELLSHIEWQNKELLSTQKDRDCWIFNANELQKGYNDLDKKLRLAQKDTERLDWLEKHSTIVGEGILGIAIKWTDTLRREIDSAIAATNDHPSYVAQTDTEAKKSINKQVDPNEDGRVGL